MRLKQQGCHDLQAGGICSEPGAEVKEYTASSALAPCMIRWSNAGHETPAESQELKAGGSRRTQENRTAWEWAVPGLSASPKEAFDGELQGKAVTSLAVGTVPCRAGDYSGHLPRLHRSVMGP